MEPEKRIEKNEMKKRDEKSKTGKTKHVEQKGSEEKNTRGTTQGAKTELERKKEKGLTKTEWNGKKRTK